MTTDIKRILYATDLSDNAAYALGHAINMAKRYEATITVLHVIDKTMESSQVVLFSYLGQAQLEENLQKRIDYLTAEINQRLKKVIDRQFADDPESAEIVTAIEVCLGYPADEILKKVDVLHCDAIVMGTHGKGIARQAFFGSVAKRILRRVRKPVFIIPLPEKKDDKGVRDH